MKKMICGILFWLSYCGLTYAGELASLPDRMYLTQHWVSYTTSFDIETKTRNVIYIYTIRFSVLHWLFYIRKLFQSTRLYIEGILNGRPALCAW